MAAPPLALECLGFADRQVLGHGNSSGAQRVHASGPDGRVQEVDPDEPEVGRVLVVGIHTQCESSLGRELLQAKRAGAGRCEEAAGFGVDYRLLFHPAPRSCSNAPG